MPEASVTLPEETAQARTWCGEFGRAYSDRNILEVSELDALWAKNYGVTRSSISSIFLEGIPKAASILEIGCNVGNQLLLLQSQGYSHLAGLELQSYALEKAKSRLPNVVLRQGSALSLPFADDSFDLVFTSGVLIHIAPGDLDQVLKEIHRCARRYIWGTEYFSVEPTSVNYRGEEDLLWKRDFAKQYLLSFDDLVLIRETRLKYVENENVDTIFLLKKTNSRGALR